MASSLGVGMDAVALAAAMAQPFKPMVLSGATTPEMLRSNAGALKIVDALVESGRLDNLMAAMRQDSHEYWCERAALEWN